MKLILENKSDLTTIEFIRLAQTVILMGRISNDNKQYCYMTSFIINGEEYHIVSDLNEKSDKLTIYKVSKQKIKMQQNNDTRTNKHNTKQAVHNRRS
jgi:hypothetical protein